MAPGSQRLRVSPERQGGGARQQGGGGKTSRATPPPRRTVSDPPLTSVGSAPPPIPFLLLSCLEIPRFPLGDHLRNHFRRVSKSGFQGAILARFCFSARSPPPSSAHLRVPNGVFQIPHLSLRERKPPSMGRRMPENTSVFKAFFGSKQKGPAEQVAPRVSSLKICRF